MTYRRLNDFFLHQDVRLGDTHGFEIIGRERTSMAEPSADIKSRYYGGARSPTSSGACVPAKGSPP
ncbi:hypothetical protein [Thermoactinospora rubra]|uniref:hypothetical protein n=1 Tax=Thermoactinospora rubra TaxID=1088767 RepID=UPI000A10F26D|nr:hypothetical protein [Thermoactinospora rubra]